MPYNILHTIQLYLNIISWVHLTHENNTKIMPRESSTCVDLPTAWQVDNIPFIILHKFQFISNVVKYFSTLCFMFKLIVSWILVNWIANDYQSLCWSKLLYLVLNLLSISRKKSYLNFHWQLIIKFCSVGGNKMNNTMKNMLHTTNFNYPH